MALNLEMLDVCTKSEKQEASSMKPAKRVARGGTRYHLVSIIRGDANGYDLVV